MVMMKSVMMLSFMLGESLLLLGCSELSVEEGTVSKAIVEQTDRTTSGVINLWWILPFQWDHVLIIKPYDDLSSTMLDSQAHNILSRIGINERDDICVLVFLSKSKVTRIVVEPRSLDFSTLSFPEYSSQEASWEIVKSVTDSMRMNLKDIEKKPRQ